MDTKDAWVASTVGAIIGAAAGYLFFTDRGRELRRQFETTLETLGPELSRFGNTINRTAGAASEGWKILNEVLGESPRPTRYPTPHQTSPF